MALRKLSPSQIRSFQEKVYSYYNAYGRDLPWRKTTDPYNIVVSEVMLQQTQVDRVIAKYNAFIARFPDMRSLAAASVKDVLAAWSGLGYNRRALYLKRLAECVVEQYQGRVPSDHMALMELPGIGPATAASIAAFAFNKPTVFIETNIRTVFIHHFFKNKKQVTDDHIRQFAAQTLDQQKPRQWYSALMDYGTMLKKQHPNPSRKSAHYYKQSPFKGSDRQLRGMILKTLLADTSVSVKELRTLFPHESQRITRIIQQLQREGFIHKKGNRFQLSSQN